MDLQEEITNKAVTLIIDGVRVTERTLERAIAQFLAAQKNKQTKQKVYRGKQSLKQLAHQNAGLANIEITDQNIRSFTSVAKKYHIDFALKKDKTTDHPRYLVFFKSRDADAMTAAFHEFTNRKLRKPSIHKLLAQAREELSKLVKQAPVKVKNRELER